MSSIRNGVLLSKLLRIKSAHCSKVVARAASTPMPLFYFRQGEKEDLYLSSADWMNRNMMRRIELAWPVRDAALRQQIIDECLVAYLHDDRDAWTLCSDGRYVRAPHPIDGHGAQNALMGRYGPPQLQRLSALTGAQAQRSSSCQGVFCQACCSSCSR